MSTLLADSEAVQQVKQDMQQFFQKHCKSATLLKERGSTDNVPATADQPAAPLPKDGIHQAAPLSKQQKKKRRQQRKSAQASSPSRSRSPVREASVTDAGSPPTDRPAQPPTAQDQSTPAEPAIPTVASASHTHSREASPADSAAAGPPSDQQRADAAKDEGNVQYKAGHYEAALASYGRAISICPETAAYYGNRAAAALMKRDYKLAMQDSLHATKLNPDFARGYQRAGGLAVPALFIGIKTGARACQHVCKCMVGGNKCTCSAGGCTS